MRTVNSKDGTTIAFDTSGNGPALVLVDGALGQRAFPFGTTPLAADPLLRQHFTVVHYDRRGRGDSTDTQPYAVAREVEDIEALIDAVGGTAFVLGISSGAALALEAAIALPGKISKLAMYEPPYNDDAKARDGFQTYRRQLRQALAEGRRGDAVGLFMMYVGLPADQLPGMRQQPMWPMWEAAAPTLAYDAEVLGEEAAVPTARAAAVAASALVMNGGESFPFMATTAVALANAMPQGQHRTLEGQTHEVAPEALAPVLVAFFAERPLIQTSREGRWEG